MRSIYRNYFYRRHLYVALVALSMIFLVAFAWVGIAAASSNQDDNPKAGEYIVTVFDSGHKQMVLSKGGTVKQILEASDIVIAKDDKVEPSLDTEINSSDFTVNVYRAHPVLIIDGMQRVSVMTSHSAPKNIAKDAGIELRDEDQVSFKQPTNILEAAGGISMQVERATPIKLTLYGKKVTAYTQATTVAEFLETKDINLGDKDDLSVKLSDPIKSGMKIEIWRNGTQTTTRNETIRFPVRQIKDMDQPVGYKKVQTPGVNGKKTVTYEILVKNGKEVKRKAIQTVVLKKPTEQVEIVGAKIAGPEEIMSQIRSASASKGIDSQRVLLIAKCESGFNPRADSGFYKGIFQHDPVYWPARAAKYGHSGASYFDVDAQIGVSTSMMAEGGWSHWGCDPGPQ